MLPPPLIVVIATCQRSQLLGRMLQSLAACERPPNLQRVIVVENGPKMGVDAVVRRFEPELPIEYWHVPEPSKSRALNHALRLCRDCFVVFFDDDVRVHPKALIAYNEEVSGRTGGVFVGGRCLVDYEQEPPAWLGRYLPFSAKGWSRGDKPAPLECPEALGFNWGAFANDIVAVGGFDEKHGPGRQVPIGEERDLQAALLAQGIKGRYRPDATVWHFVPLERCSPEWTLRRTLLMGVSAGMKLAGLPRFTRWSYAFSCRVRLALFDALLATCSRSLSVEQRFHFQQRRNWRKGFFQGLHVPQL